MDDLKKSRVFSNLFLLYIFLIVGLEASVLAKHASNPIYHWVNVVVGGLIIFSWLIYDNRARGHSSSPLFKIGVVALAVVFVPIYLFKTRKAKTACISILKYLGKFLIVFVLLVFLLVGLELLGLSQSAG